MAHQAEIRVGSSGVRHEFLTRLSRYQSLTPDPDNLMEFKPADPSLRGSTDEAFQGNS